MPSPPADQSFPTRIFDADDAQTVSGQMRGAAADIAASIALAWFWRLLAWRDIRRRYPARSLGPIWVTLHTLLLVGVIGLVFGRAWAAPYEEFLPYLATGWVIWQFLAGVINESSALFLDATLVATTPHPLFIQVLRLVSRNLFLLGCNVPVVLAALVYFRFGEPIYLLPALAGFVLLVVNAVWICTLLGLLAARYRDVQPIIAVAMQPLFFLTPVLWPAKSLGSWHFLVAWNPLYYALESVRGPLLGQAPDMAFLAGLALAALAGSMTAFAAFARFRARIAYWL